MKRLFQAFVGTAFFIPSLSGSALAQDSMRMVEHTGPAASPGVSGATGGVGTTTAGVGIGAGASPSVADVHGPNLGVPSKGETGTVSDSVTNNGMTVDPNSTNAVATHQGIAGTARANPQNASSP